MSSQGSKLNRLLIALLIVADVFLCILLFKRQKEWNERFYDIRADKILYADALQGAVVTDANIGTLEVTSELDNLSLFSQTEVRDALCLLLPPHPCDVCLDRELEKITDFAVNHSEREILLFVPLYREREFRAILATIKNIRLFVYDTQRMSYLPLRECEGMVYFMFRKGRVENVYVANKHVPDATDVYLNNYLSK